ncbi:MAG: SDR family oxidoreductase [Candidatus Omnitrophica bacterium]|nr:SDR family oxidoreductase [Candidatus Omnitrophota bacterium]
MRGTEPKEPSGLFRLQRRGGVKKPVLVTGGAGFIGSHLVDALVRRKHQVRVLDNLSTGSLGNLQAVFGKIQFIRGDIREPALLRRAVQGVRVIYHQAALRSVPKSVARPMEYHEVNATATFQLLLLAQEAGVKRVVYASSSSVYGDQTPLPQSEGMQPGPKSPYAASKLASEVYCSMFTRLWGLETVGLRYFNVFGPRQSLENEYAVVIPKFITCLLRGERPPIHGDGRQTRDFTYVENVVLANLKAAAAPRVGGEVFNVASGSRHSVLELARLLNRKIGVRISPRLVALRPGDVRHTWADIRKARRLLGYRVAVPFTEGLDRTIAWFSRNRSVWNGPGV